MKILNTLENKMKITLQQHQDISNSLNAKIAFHKQSISNLKLEIAQLNTDIQYEESLQLELPLEY